MSSDCFALPSLEHYSSIFFFTATATTEIYTLSLHDALPICVGRKDGRGPRQSSGLALNDAQLLPVGRASAGVERGESGSRDRKSTRLNSSHVAISYAVFCLKKKTKNENKSSKKRTNVCARRQ